jgi:hypothetical protein
MGGMGVSAGGWVAGMKMPDVGEGSGVAGRLEALPGAGGGVAGGCPQAASHKKIQMDTARLKVRRVSICFLVC